MRTVWPLTSLQITTNMLHPIDSYLDRERKAECSSKQLLRPRVALFSQRVNVRPAVRVSRGSRRRRQHQHCAHARLAAAADRRTGTCVVMTTAFVASFPPVPRHGARRLARFCLNYSPATGVQGGTQATPRRPPPPLFDSAVRDDNASLCVWTLE